MSKQPSIARRIERISSLVGTPVADHDAAAAVASASDADVGPILEALRRAIRTVPSAARAAERFPRPDPRVAAFLAELFERSPYKKRRDGQVDAGVIDALAAIDDPRFRPLLANTAEDLAARRDHYWVLRKDRIAHLVEVASELAARPAPPPLSDDEVAALIAIDDALDRSAAVEIPSLYAAVYAKPDDDAARLVLADALQERGDPRGEFIALQMSGGSPRRESQLLKIHARAWLGPLEPHVRKRGVVFRRGFPAAAIYARYGYDDVLADPAWHTLEDFDCDGGWGAPFVRWLMTLRGLHGVRRVYHEHAALLASPAWTTLGIRWGTAATLDALDAGKLPALVELDLASARADVCALQPHALARQVKRVRMSTTPDRGFTPDVAANLAAARELGIELEIVADYDFPPAPEHDALVFAGDHVTWRPARKKLALAWVGSVLDKLPRGTIRTATLASGDRSYAQHVLASFRIDLL